MHAIVAVMYPRFDYIKFAQVAVQQKSVPWYKSVESTQDV